MEERYLHEEGYLYDDRVLPSGGLKQSVGVVSGQKQDLG